MKLDICIHIHFPKHPEAKPVLLHGEFEVPLVSISSGELVITADAKLAHKIMSYIRVNYQFEPTNVIGDYDTGMNLLFLSTTIDEVSYTITPEYP